MINRQENKVFFSKNNEKLLNIKGQVDKTNKLDEKFFNNSVPSLPVPEPQGEESEKTNEEEGKEIKDKKSENEKFDVIKILHENLTGTTFHSIGYIFDTPDYFLKVVLGICFLASAVYCGYVIVQSFIQFFSFSVLTSTTIVSDIPAEFPVVGFCNLNQFDFNYATEAVYNLTNDGTINPNDPTYTADDYVEAVSEYFRFNLMKRNINSLERLYRDNFMLDQMLISCKFLAENCSITDFIFNYDFDYGLCWRFNTGRDLFGNTTDVRTSGQVGWMSGLRLELYAGHAQLQEKFSIKRGFRLFIFNRTNVNPIPEDIGIDVSTGQCTSVGLRRTLMTHLAYPYSSCLPTDITQINWNTNDVLKFMYDNFVSGQYYSTNYAWDYAGEWTWNWTVSYSQTICIQLCFQKYLYETCGCYDISLPRSPAVSQLYLQNACINETQLSCDATAEDTFYTTASLVDQCYDDCPIECSDLRFELSVATSSYPTEWYAQVLTNNSNFNSVINTYFADANVPFINYTNRYADLKNAIARVHVFYEDLRVIEIDENPAMDIVALLGSLGGNLGLFLGASVLSFTELFIFLYDLTKQGLKVLYAKNQMRKLKRNKITGSVVDDPNYNSVAAIKIDRSLLA